MKNSSCVTSAFIRKNTLELRTKLESLGYSDSGYSSIEHDSIATTAFTKKYTCIPQSLYDENNPHINWRADGTRVDCGKDEEMFFSLITTKLN